MDILEATEAEIENAIWNQYTTSRDFNGLLIEGKEKERLRKKMLSLAAKGRCRFVTEEEQVVPFTLRYRINKEESIEHIRTSRLDLVLGYPGEPLAEERTKDQELERPYTRALLRGEGQLEPRFFSLGVLERYKNDPRYLYDFNDISGRIYTGESRMEEAEQLSLSRLGVGYADSDSERLIIAFNRDLRHLSGKHQRHWESHQFRNAARVHPDFITTNYRGYFPRYTPVLTAITIELENTARTTKGMGRQALFRKSYYKDRPKALAMLLRPTQKEFTEFFQTLDKMLSDNIDKSFFNKDVPCEVVTTDKLGVQTKTPLGSVTILGTWLKKVFTEQKYEELINAIVGEMKIVRNLRNPAAHTILTDEFEPNLIQKQRERVFCVYNALYHLRNLLEHHPDSTIYDRIAIDYDNIWFD